MFTSSTKLFQGITPATSAAAYQISRSLRFNSADSANLTRTPASAGNRKTWTWSGWVKRSNLGGAGPSLFGCYSGTGNPRDALQFATDIIEYAANTSGSSFDVSLKTTQVFRDASAWYHIMFAADTTQATASNRIKIYVNGVQITAFSTATYPTLNVDLPTNQAQIHYLGASLNGNYFDGYITEVYFIDGQALDPTSFGETDSATGVWVPKAYTGTYGTNGFWLKFDDNSNTTATTLGKDSSGNSNNWTPNNFSVTAGAGNDSLVDSPTNYGTDTGAGGEVRGNYATLNPLAKFASTSQTPTLANGNLDITGAVSSSYSNAVSTLGVSSGKWYAEYTVGTLGTANGIGFVNAASLASVDGNYGIGAPSDGWLRVGTLVLSNSANAVTGLSTIASNDVVMLAIDFDAGKAWWGRNGTWESSGNPATGANATVTFTPGGKTFLFGNAGYSASVAITGSANFGQRPFAYTAPSGFKALCTQNLPIPTVGATSTTLANKYMDVSLYTGTGAVQSVTNSGSMQPDFVWLKNRNSTEWHSLFDAVRGALQNIRSNSTNAEVTATGTLTSFNSNGFSLGTDPSSYGVNTNTFTYVAWQWKANGAGSSNTAGSITSTVSANTTAGISVVTYTGTGANATVGHGLGKAPSMIIVKNRDQVTDWLVGHSSLTSWAFFLKLNATSAQASASTVWNSTAPTSTLFSIGTDGGVNSNTIKYVAYCFAEIAGFSKFGSYTGNGSADGAFVYCGFRPKYVMFRRSDSAASWVINDSSRSPYNVANDILYAESSSAEVNAGTGAVVDFLSNGFKLRNGNADYGASGGTYIFMAFAESPFNYSRAR